MKKLAVGLMLLCVMCFAVNGLANAVQDRVRYLSQLHYTETEFRTLESRSPSALAQLYVTLTEAQDWLKALSALTEDKNKPAITSAWDNMEKNLRVLYGFHQQNLQRSFIGDGRAYENPDAIIVLSCNSVDMLNQRLQRALDLARKFTGVPVVLSGDGRSLRHDATYMRQYMLARGIKEGQLIMENDAVDTIGNAVFSRWMLEKQRPHTLFKKLLVVTSDFHAARALYIFQQVMGFDHEIAVAQAPSTLAPERLMSYTHAGWTSEAMSTKTVFTLPMYIQASQAQQQAITGDICSILYEMFITHSLYKDRWDLARRYLPSCSAK